MTKIPTIKEIMPHIATKQGLYSANMAHRYFRRQLKQLPRKDMFKFACRMSMAKWKLPKMVEAVKKGNPDMAMTMSMNYGGQCGLCFLGLNEGRQSCGVCDKFGFDCKEFFWDSEEEVNAMLQAIRRLERRKFK